MATKKKTGLDKIRKDQALAQMSFADLYAMYLFVVGEASRHFNTAPGARKVVLQKEKEIRAELCKRTYGMDPLEEFRTAIEIEGEDPTDLLGKTFIVSKPADKGE